MLRRGFEPESETVAHTVRAASRVIQIPILAFSNSNHSLLLADSSCEKCSDGDLNPGHCLERAI